MNQNHRHINNHFTSTKSFSNSNSNKPRSADGIAKRSSKPILDNFELEELSKALRELGYSAFSVTLSFKQSPRDLIEYRHSLHDLGLNPSIEHTYEYQAMMSERKANGQGFILSREESYRQICKLPMLSRIPLRPSIAEAKEKQDLKAWLIQNSFLAFYENLCRCVVNQRRSNSASNILKRPICFYFLEVTPKSNRTQGIDPIHIHAVLFARGSVAARLEQYVGMNKLLILYPQLHQSLLEPFSTHQSAYINKRDDFYVSYASSGSHPVYGRYRDILPVDFLDRKAEFMKPMDPSDDADADKPGSRVNLLRAACERSGRHLMVETAKRRRKH